VIGDDGLTDVEQREIELDPDADQDGEEVLGLAPTPELPPQMDDGAADDGLTDAERWEIEQDPNADDADDVSMQIVVIKVPPQHSAETTAAHPATAPLGVELMIPQHSFSFPPPPQTIPSSVVILAGTAIGQPGGSAAPPRPLPRPVLRLLPGMKLKELLASRVGLCEV
jgi:hypothetical protein